MELIETNIEGLYVVELKYHSDSRGWFVESHNKNTFSKLGINIDFVQDNHSFSAQKGILRGLHLQNHPYAQTKLVRCTKGSIWDVAVDLRKDSPTYKQWFGLELTDSNHKMLLIPQGFAHGFITLTDNCEVQYKVDNYYNKEADRSIHYLDSEINIKWPFLDVILSDKDKNAKNLKDTEVNF